MQTQKIKKKKGFTLVEIIVVLVIVAILAAAGIPSLLGFIESSNSKAYVAEARAGYQAVQSVYTEVRLGTGTAPTVNADFQFTGDALTKLTAYLAPDLVAGNFQYRFDAANNTVAAVLYNPKDNTYIRIRPGQPADTYTSAPTTW